MRKLVLPLLVVAALGGAYVFTHYRIEGLGNLKIVPLRARGHEAGLGSGATIRIATFNVQALGPSKLDKPRVADVLGRIIREFDVVALQEVRSDDEDLLPRLVEIINRAGRKYDYVLGPRVGRGTEKEQFAFLFDRDTIEVDRAQLYTVDDPYDRLHREPLVGWFRTRGPSPEAAFTFSLVNLHVDAADGLRELAALSEVYRIVRDDGRGEDDVILAGDFGAGDSRLESGWSGMAITTAIAQLPTDTRGVEQLDNLLFSPGATVEHVGRSGVFDFMRQYNMTLDEALEISDHLPVWAEFTTREGGQADPIAQQPAQPVSVVP